MTKRILVVDDDRNIGQILYVSFKSKGYETIMATNGEEALRLFEEIQPDLILLDVLLPKMNGWEVCQRIKETEIGKHTPVILMSAIYKSYKLQADARKKYGADDFVEKPFQLAKLLEKVYSFVGEGSSEAKEKADEANASAPTPSVQEPVPDGSPSAILEGDLSEFAFPSLLHKVYVMGRSGILNLTSNEKSKEIAFKEGYPVSVKSNIEGEFLGRYLVSIRKVTAEQCDESLKRMERTGRLQGTVLIEMGALTPNELVRYLKLQMRTKVFEVFGWQEGQYHFIEDDTVVGDISNIDMSPANIILRGISNRVELERLIGYVDRYNSKYLARSSNLFYQFQELDLSPSERKLLKIIDGRRVVRDLLAESELDLDKTYQLLYTFLVTEMYEPLNEPVDQSDYLLQLEAEDAEAARPEIPNFKDILREVNDEGDAEDIPSNDFTFTSPPSEDIGVDQDYPAPAVSTDSATDEAGGDFVMMEKPEEDSEAVAAEEPSTDPTEDSEMRRKILDKYEGLESQTFFEVLDVGEEPTEHEVRAAYHKLAKEFHPDRFFGKVSSAVKSKAEEIFLKVSEAYEALGDEEKIEQYKKVLSGGEEKKADPKMENVKAIIRGERAYQTGIQMIRDRKWEEAVEAFTEAMENAPGEPEYIAYYGWALFNVGRAMERGAKIKKELSTASDLQFQARENLNRALEVNPRLEKGYVFLGYVYKAQGLQEFAERQFEKALMTNPNCLEALRELRLMRLAEQRANAKNKTFFQKMKDRTTKMLKRK